MNKSKITSIMAREKCIINLLEILPIIYLNKIKFGIINMMMGIIKTKTLFRINKLLDLHHLE